MSDPKARVVDLAHELWAVAQLAPGEGIEDAANRIADRLDSAGLLASAPVVPSLAELREVYRKAISNAREDHAGAGIEAIHNHLLTLGWREK